MSQFVGKIWDKVRRALGGMVDEEDGGADYDPSKGGARTLDFVQSAIYNLRERNGSTFEDILDYLCSQYEVDEQTVRGRVMTALRRGVSIGVLEQEGNLYRLTKYREKKIQKCRKDPQSSKTNCGNIPVKEEPKKYENTKEDIDVLEIDDNY